jgi:hypothetical protein
MRPMARAELMSAVIGEPPLVEEECRRSALNGCPQMPQGRETPSAVVPMARPSPGSDNSDFERGAPEMFGASMFRTRRDASVA